MAYPYAITTRGTGTVVTATIYNGDHQNHPDSQTPGNTDDYSVNAVQMQTVTDPGEVGTESLATTLTGELERLRFAMKELTGGAQWYESVPGATIAGSRLSRVIDRQTTTIDIVNTTVETDLYRFTVPANTLGTNRALRLTLFGDRLRNGALANAEMTFKFGGFSVGILNDQPASNANRRMYSAEIYLMTKGATNSQVARMGRTMHQIDNQGLDGLQPQDVRLSVFTLAVDSTVIQDLVVTGRWTVADVNNSLRRLNAVLELLS